MLKCPNLPEIILPHIDDSYTWCILSNVNKNFNKMCKNLLIQGEWNGKKYYEKWTQLPCNRFRHGLYTLTSYSSKFGNRIGYFVNDNLNGTCEEWYSNGVKWFKYKMLNGKINGVCKEWHSNGVKKFKGKYKNDKKHGVHKKWLESGKLIKKVKYKNGKKKRN